MEYNDIEDLLKKGKEYIILRKYDKSVEAFDHILNIEPDNKDALQGNIASLRLLHRFEEADKLIQKALNRLPDNPKILNERGWLYCDQKKYDKAIDAFSQVLKIESNNENALLGKIASLRGQTRFEEANGLIQEALTRLPDNPKILNERGWVYCDQEKYDKAIDAFDLVLNIESDNEDALRGKITTLRLLHRFVEADKLIQEALTRLPDNPKILNERGWLNCAQKKYDKAIDAFDYVLNIEFNNEDALRGKSTTLRLLHRFEEDDKLIQEALTRLPDNPKILNERGRLYYKQRQYDKAVEAFDKVLAKEPYNEKALLWKIDALQLQRRFEEADRLIQEALNRLPNSIEILKERGRMYYTQKKYDKAIETFSQVLDIYPNNEDAVQEKIASLRSRTRFEEADKLIQEALTHFPESDRIHNERGRLYYYQKKYDKAVEAFDVVLKIDEKNEYALQWKIDTLRLQHEFEAADKLIEKGLKLYPKSVKILNERCRLLYCQKKYDKAIDAFDYVLDIDPYNEDALQGKIASFRMQRRFDDACKSTADALKKRSDSFRILTEAALLYTDQAKFIKAREYLERANRLDHENLYLRNAFGYFYRRQNDWMKAKKEFEFVLKKDSSNINGLAGLGEFYLKDDRPREAEERFHDGLKLKKKCHMLLTNLAWVEVRYSDAYKNRHKIEKYLGEAEKLCREALDNHPNYIPAFVCLAAIAFKRGNISESEDYLLKSMKLGLKEGTYLGALYIRIGRYKEAEDNLKKALKINERDVQAHIELGNLYLETERINEAILEFRQARAIDPNNNKSHRALAIGLMRHGDFIEAEKVLRDAIQSLDMAKRWRLHLTLSQLLTRLGEEDDERQFYEEALKEANKAKKLRPERPEPYFYSGIARCKLKDYNGALKDFKSCSRKDERQFEAERNASIIESQIHDTRRQDFYWERIIIGLIALILLAFVWYIYFTDTGKVAETNFMVVTIILLFFIGLAGFLPSLHRFKLAGIEAEMSPPKDLIISEKNLIEIGFSSFEPAVCFERLP